MVEHFRRVQKNTESVEIALPFEEGFASGDRLFTYHLIRARARAEDADRFSLVMGYAVVEGGKISGITYNSYNAVGFRRKGLTRQEFYVTQVRMSVTYVYKSLCFLPALARRQTFGAAAVAGPQVGLASGSPGLGPGRVVVSFACYGAR